MPRRNDIESVLIIGAGPIVIGQACEFDYSGTQACKALQEEGYRVVLANSNPATIMTDPSSADAVYIEPIHWRTLERIIERERPDALLPTMGGQTGLNCALDLVRHGVLKKYGVELIGASRDAIDMAEDRERFRDAMREIGLEVPTADVARNLDQAWEIQAKVGFPTIVRPSFTLGGSGGGIAYNREEFEEIVSRGLDQSPTTEVLLEESVLGWKEFEMEVVRDHNDNCIIVCSIENLDPMGIHTGDSITVAPAQTLTDKEYQLMRDASIAVLRKIGVDTGGSNVQFAVNPHDGRLIIIEMNPRVSRSSALASKATGFPIAKVAAKLAVGYTLDELRNEITGGATPASFEPSIDYVVTKVPRFTFEKFPQANDRLTTQMKSVGEVMAIGRTFQESLQKALRGIETGTDGLNPVCGEVRTQLQRELLRRELRMAGGQRIWYVADGFRHGLDLDEVADLTGIDMWFLAQIRDLVDEEARLEAGGAVGLTAERMWQLKRKGFSDSRIGELIGWTENHVRTKRYEYNLKPVFKRVDTCAAEFASHTAYLYSTYESECEADPTTAQKIMILGGGPNRIGQGIEFDYCCVHASFALKEAGFETIMVNCNPETVSTDYDTSDRLYFEPLTLEDVLAIVDKEQPLGVIVQYGGQTPLKLARSLEAAGVPIIGTSPDSIDLGRGPGALSATHHAPWPEAAGEPHGADHRGGRGDGPRRWAIRWLCGRRMCWVAGPWRSSTRKTTSGSTWKKRSAYPTRAPSCWIVSWTWPWRWTWMRFATASRSSSAASWNTWSRRGVHSGDSGCCLPPFTLSAEQEEALEEQVAAMARGLGVIGIMNTQFAIQNGTIYVLEVNPRASRTIPFVSKATGQPFAKIAAKAMAGITFREQGIVFNARPPYYSVKESVFPFIKFPEADPILGPEMKSTGEVMGTGRSFGEAYAKAQAASGVSLPRRGTALISVRDPDKPAAVELGHILIDRGFEIVATGGTARALVDGGVRCRRVNKVREGRPHVVDMIKNDEISLIVNTTEGKQAIKESHSIRVAAVHRKVTYYTTLPAATATCEALDYMDNVVVNRLRDLHREIAQ